MRSPDPGVRSRLGSIGCGEEDETRHPGACGRAHVDRVTGDRTRECRHLPSDCKVVSYELYCVSHIITLALICGSAS